MARFLSVNAPNLQYYSYLCRKFDNNVSCARSSCRTVTHAYSYRQPDIK